MTESTRSYKIEPIEHRHSEQNDIDEALHKRCRACLHTYKHGVSDGYALAMRVLMRCGQPAARDLLGDHQRRNVTAFVQKVGTLLEIPPDAVDALMEHRRNAPLPRPQKPQ